MGFEGVFILELALLVERIMEKKDGLNGRRSLDTENTAAQILVNREQLCFCVYVIYSGAYTVIGQNDVLYTNI